jgi:hypothetical protein
MYAQCSLLSLKSRIFGLGQANWEDKFWGIWVIFSHCQHPFWYSESLVHVFRYSTIISTKNEAFIWDRDLNLGRKELGI